jgi:Protein of unknown function (DUF1059)
MSAKVKRKKKLWENAKQHAIQHHHYKAEELMTPELQQKIKSHIKRA